MPNRYATGKPDKNKNAITAVLVKAGKHFIHLHEKDGADLLVIDNPMFFVEIKRDDLTPSKTQLTPAELVLQEICKGLGIGYHVVKSAEEMARVLGERIEKSH